MAGVVFGSRNTELRACSQVVWMSHWYLKLIMSLIRLCHFLKNIFFPVISISVTNLSFIHFLQLESWSSYLLIYTFYHVNKCCRFYQLLSHQSIFSLPSLTAVVQTLTTSHVNLSGKDSYLFFLHLSCLLGNVCSILTPEWPF